MQEKHYLTVNITYLHKCIKLKHLLLTVMGKLLVKWQLPAISLCSDVYQQGFE